jgi:outer membrane protein TolC
MVRAVSRGRWVPPFASALTVAVLVWAGLAARAGDDLPAFPLERSQNPPTEGRPTLTGPCPIPDSLPAFPILRLLEPTPPVAVTPAVGTGEDRPLPINLATALQLANVRPLDVAVAQERVRVAAAQLERARVLWLPTLQLGPDYYRHDGRIQDTTGNVFDVSRSSFMAGLAPQAVFSVSEALFGPLAARQIVQAREASRQAAVNDSMLAVAEAYFSVQQARGDLAAAEEVARRAADLARRTKGLNELGLAPELEISRTRAELARRQQAVAAARERWRTASADLARVLRLDPGALLEPQEPAHLQITLVALEGAVDDLIQVGLTNRPELAAQQALVRAALERLRQERLRPLVPSVLLRGAATNPAGTLAFGVFGGGRNDSLTNFNLRSDFDLQLLWEFQNLGLGNKDRVAEQRAEHRLALLEAFRLQDRVAAEVAQAYAQARAAAVRLRESEDGLKNAVDTVEKISKGLENTRRIANQDVLLIRPQEAVAGVQALAQAYVDYYAALADSNRAQFRLYRALGHPAQTILGPGSTCGPDIGSAPPPAPVEGKLPEVLPPSGNKP